MLSIRPTKIDDAARLTELIHELATYEKLDHEASVTEDDVVRDGFGPKPKFRALFAEWDGQVVGYAVFFEFYSSFQGRAGLFLDDLYVRPQFRKKGIGRALLAQVAVIAWNEGYFCVRWEVLDWNTTAQDFYKGMGAVFLDEWKEVCLIGDALQMVAQEVS